MKKMYWIIAALLAVAAISAYLLVQNQKSNNPVMRIASDKRIAELEQAGLPLQIFEREFMPAALPTFSSQKLFVIDEKLIFWQRDGLAQDYAFHYILMDKTQKELCSYQDSIAGARTECSDPAFADLFKIILGNINKNNFGLTNHRVERVYSATSLRY